MSGRHLSSEDRRELAKLTKLLSQKIVQVVVQSRLGEKAFTKSKTPAQGSEWFNLGIEDIPDIQTETKKSLGGHLPEVGKPLVVEILLRTPESETLVLEIWTLTVLDACDTSPARVNPTIYNRMTVLLKSLIAVTRITPAYKLSFRQGADSFIILYRVYLGDPNYDCLGESQVRARLGQVTTPESTMLLCVNYRTNITLSPPSRSPAQDAIMLKSDHFKPEVSPRHCRRGTDRANDSSEATQTSDDSQDAARFFTASPPDQPSTPRSRTSSDSSCRGYVHQQQQQQQQQPPERKVSVAFVDAKPPKPDDFFMPEVPFSNLLTSAIEVPQEKKADKLEATVTPQDKTTQDKAVGGVGSTNPDTGEKVVMTASDSSHKSVTSAQLKDESDFVMVELLNAYRSAIQRINARDRIYRSTQNRLNAGSGFQRRCPGFRQPKNDYQVYLVRVCNVSVAPETCLKTPFAMPCDTGNDLGAFYRECQSAPPLRMFADTPEDEICDLAEQLLSFEANVEEYNELVKSLHSDSPSSPD